MSELDPGARLKLSAACAYQYIEGEAVVVQPRGRMMHVLNDVGTFLWQEVEKGATVGALVGWLTDEFEVDEATARRDVQAFVQELVQKGLVEAA